MLSIKETRQVKAYSPMTGKVELMTKNICIGRDGKEICSHWDGYFYINSNNSIGKRRYRL